MQIYADNCGWMQVHENIKWLLISAYECRAVYMSSDKCRESQKNKYIYKDDCRWIQMNENK